MGGNALSKPSKRLSKDEFVRVRKEVLDKFRDANLGLYTFYPIKAYLEKDSFGDLDILYTAADQKLPMRDVIKNIFGDVEVVSNGDCTSFDYDGFQVDMIWSNDESFDFAYQYFNWNDLGNFIGRTAHRLGFKFGHDGLSYVIRDEDQPERVVKKIVVTTDFKTAMHFLGFDWHQSMEFKTPEEIFRYAASSEYFSPESFLFGQRNHTARVRDKKRKMYNECLAYYTKKYNLKEDDVVPKLDKAEHLQRAFEAFPKFKREFDEAMANHQADKNYRSIVNGDLVRDWTNLEGPALGKLMQQIQMYVNRHALRPWLSSGLNKDSALAILLTIIAEVKDATV